MIFPLMSYLDRRTHLPQPGIAAHVFKYVFNDMWTCVFEYYKAISRNCRQLDLGITDFPYSSIILARERGTHDHCRGVGWVRGGYGGVEHATHT